ncbi:MAG TPA: hypothetical protein VF373_04730 [Prolixibacteraceae bacterium]
MNRNSKVLEAIKQLPEEFSIEELLDQMRLLEKIEIGLARSEEKQEISDEELNIEIAEWFN